jgi:hypothetical protein
MLYGHSQAVGVPPGTRASRWLAVTLRSCFEVNRDAHRVLRYPQNYQSLPAVLKARIKDLLAVDLGGADKRKGWRAEAKETYLQMSKSVAPSWVKGTDPTYLNYFRCVASVVGRHQSGNCAEYCALVVNMLVDRGVQEHRIRLLQGGLGLWNNHICVVVDSAEGASPAEPATYGGGAVVCDGWLDLVAAAEEYFRVLDAINCGFKPTALVPLSVKVM